MFTRTVIGAAACFIIFAASFLYSGNAAVYFNLTALAVVASGTLGAALLSSGYARLRQAFAAARGAYGPVSASPAELVRQFVRLAILTRRDELPRLEAASEMEYTPLLEALRLVEDDYAEHEVRDILVSEMRTQAIMSGSVERVWRNMATYAPSFGVAGSVVGLIGLLMGLGDTALILKSIPVALVSTLYGVVAANFLFAPVAEKISRRAEEEAGVMAIIVEGAAALTQKPNARRLMKRLNSMAEPSQRLGDEEMLETLRSFVANKRTRAQEETRKEPGSARKAPLTNSLPPEEAALSRTA